MLIVLAVVVAIELAGRWRGQTWPRRLPLHKVAAGIALLLLPALAVVLGHWTHAYDHRYVIFGSVGLAIAIPIAIWALTPANGVGELIFAGTLAVTFVQFSMRRSSIRPSRSIRSANIRRWSTG